MAGIKIIPYPWQTKKWVKFTSFEEDSKDFEEFDDFIWERWEESEIFDEFSRSRLYESQKNVADLKDQLQEAEESAKYKSEELSDAIVKLRKYETGEYGLKQAIEELETCKKAERLGEKQCQDLTKSCNDLEFMNIFNDTTFNNCNLF